MDSFTEYVTTRGARLLRLAYVMCGDRHLAEDLVQSALIRLHGKWAKVEAADSPDAYVRRSLVHEYLSWRRRLMNREIVLGELPEPPSVAGVEARTVERDEMWRRLGALPRAQRVVLALRFYEDLDYPEIAAVMGVRPSTVRVHASRGLTALRLQLNDEATGSAGAVAAFGGQS